MRLSKLLAAVVAGSVLVSFRRISRRAIFRGKVVLITGGSRGLGLVLARQLGQAGARVALLARDSEELERAAADVRASRAEVLVIAADVTLPETPDAAVQQVLSSFGRLDVLINNAGMINVGPIDEMTESDYRKNLEIHFWAPLRFMNAALPELKRRRGRIVNISSFGGKVPVPHLAPYCASKFALHGISNGFHSELARDDVKVTSVFPGLMRTGSHVAAMFKGQRAKEFAWFALGAATPLTSISAERAARMIIDACAAGKPELILSIQARLATIAYAIFPSTVLRLLAVVNRCLPTPAAERGQPIPGNVARGPFPPASLLAMADASSRANNEPL